MPVAGSCWSLRVRPLSITTFTPSMVRLVSAMFVARTIFRSADGRIARHVIAVNMAHMAALIGSGEVDRRTGARCLKFLLGASSDTSPGARAEDFHQQLEQQAVDSLGVEAAGYLNYGKSRNDQVATAIRMELRMEVLALLGNLSELQRSLLKQAAGRGTVIIPGYTHMQRAQPVTLAHHLFAHFDAFQRDSERLLQLYARVNLSPMGGAAMAGTPVKVDRRAVADSLGFDGVVRNATDAVSGRDLMVEALSCATVAMLDASRLAEELILWSSTEFAFVELDDAYAASSSIMPQKKNAVAAELVRAKAGSVMGRLVAGCAILKALPYSYNLDLQEVTPHVWGAFDDALGSMAVLSGMVSSAAFHTETLRSAVAGDSSTAVALANHLVRENGISFRQAHAIVGQLVRTSVETGTPLDQVAASKMPSVSARFGKRISMDRAAARAILDPQRFLNSIATEGGSNPRSIQGGLRVREGELAQTQSALSGLNSSLRRSGRKLNSIASGIAREVKS